jgi:hypothetical protein
MKLKLKGRCFESAEEIQAVIKMLTQNAFHQCFPTWTFSWDRSINADVARSQQMETNKHFVS